MEGAEQLSLGVVSQSQIPNALSQVSPTPPQSLPKFLDPQQRERMAAVQVST